MQRTVSVFLRAVAGQYRSEMGEAARATEQVGRAAESSAQQAQQAGGRISQTARTMRQSARDNAEAWQSTGGMILSTAAPVAALGAAAAKTGIEYNQLRQTTVAALTSITGSAELANEQMDRLDRFASSSPFARDVFIRAQQQMLGFGIEARKVIPYLNSIQNAVAAAGGSNNDIAELSRIFSQISASAKITATDLREFGNRGIDAATLIGSQMGMTGAQIREAITDGTLDAQDALDALAAGMQERFDGAAAGVKETFAGATDRVKAAFRDLSATIMDPFVSSDGGGFLVGAFNTAADFMRLMESLPDPVLQAGGVILGLGTAAATAAGGFLVLYPRIVSAVDNLSSLGIMGQRAQRGVRALPGILTRVGATAGAIGLTAAVFGNLTAAMQNRMAMRNVERIADHLFRVADAGERLADVDLNALVRDMPTTFGMASIEAENLGDVLDKLIDPSFNDKAADFFGGLLQIVAPGLETYTDQYRALGEAMDEAFTMAVEAGEIEAVRDALAGSGYSAEELARALPGTTAALEEHEAQAGDTAAGLDEVAAASEEAQEASENFMEALATGSMKFVDVLGAYDAVIDKNREMAEAHADSTASSKDSWENYYDGVSVSMSDYLDELQRQVDAQTAWEQNMSGLSARLLPIAGEATNGILEELGRLGPEGAPLVESLVNASDEELARWVDLAGNRTAQAGQEFAAGIIEAIPLMRAAFTSMGDDSIAALAERLKNGETTVQEEIDAWRFGPPAPVPIDVETGEALTAAQMLSPTIEETWRTPMLPIDMDAAAAEQRALVFRDFAEGMDPTMRLFADTDPAEESRAGLEQAVLDTTPDITVGALTGPGRTEVDGLMLWVGNQSAAVTVTADTSQAMSRLAALDATLNAISGRTVTASVAIQQYGQAAFADGGYTGDGGKYEPAGIVHRGEYVIPKEQTRKHYALLRAIHLGLDGYANGGLVGYANGGRVAQAGSTLSFAASFDVDFTDLLGAYDAVIEKNREVAQATADATKSSKDSWEDYYDGVTVRTPDLIRNFEDQVRAHQKWEAQIASLSGRISGDLLAALGDLGARGADLVQQLAGSTAAELEQIDRHVRTIERVRDAVARNSRIQGYIDDIRQVADATDIFAEATSDFADRVSGTFMDALRDMGAEGVQMALDLRHATDQQLSFIDSLYQEAAAMRAAQEAAEEAARAREQWIEQTGRAVAGVVDAFAFNIGSAQQAFLDEYDALWDSMTGRERLEESQRLAGEVGGSWVDVFLSEADRMDAVLAGFDPFAQWTAALEEQVRDQERLQEGLLSLAARVSDDLLTELARRGDEALPYVEALLGATDEELAHFEDLFAAASVDAGESFAEKLLDAAPTLREAGATVGDEAVAAIVEALQGGESSAQAALDRWQLSTTATVHVQQVQGYRSGGAVYGPGTGTSDSVPATLGGAPVRLSNGEHVWTDAEVRAAGGHAAMYALRNAALAGQLRGVGYAQGGAVGPSLSSRPAAPVVASTVTSVDLSEAALDRLADKMLAGAGAVGLAVVRDQARRARSGGAH